MVRSGVFCGLRIIMLTAGRFFCDMNRMRAFPNYFALSGLTNVTLVIPGHRERFPKCPDRAGIPSGNVFLPRVRTLLYLPYEKQESGFPHYGRPIESPRFATTIKTIKQYGLYKKIKFLSQKVVKCKPRCYNHYPKIRTDFYYPGLGTPNPGP